MKKNKVIECVCCDGKGYTDNYACSYEDKEGYNYTIYKKVKCEYCDGKGVFSTDDLTYHVTVNTIRNFIYKLKSDKLTGWYDVFDTCDECDGTGLLEVEDVTDNDYVKIIKKKVCKKCNGEGSVINYKKTRIKKQEMIKDEYKKLNYINSIQNIDNLKHHATVRTEVQKLDAKRLNVCLNCTNFENNLSWSKTCDKCNYHNIETDKVNFNPIDIRSKKWYDNINK